MVEEKRNSSTASLQAHWLYPPPMPRTHVFFFILATAALAWSGHCLLPLIVQLLPFVSWSHGTHVSPQQYITTTVNYSQSALVNSCFCSLLKGHSSVACMRQSHVLPHTRHMLPGSFVPHKLRSCESTSPALKVKLDRCTWRHPPRHVRVDTLRCGALPSRGLSRDRAKDSWTTRVNSASILEINIDTRSCVKKKKHVRYTPVNMMQSTTHAPNYAILKCLKLACLACVPPPPPLPRKSKFCLQLRLPLLHRGIGVRGCIPQLACQR